MIRISALTVACLTLAAVTVWADGLPFEPGLWTTKVTTNNPFIGSQQNESTECITETEFDPASLMQGNNQCSISEQSVDGNVMTFALSCTMPEGTTTAQGRFESLGDSGKGEMTMTMSMGAQSMEMAMQWESIRVGDCEE